MRTILTNDLCSSLEIYLRRKPSYISKSSFDLFGCFDLFCIKNKKSRLTFCATSFTNNRRMNEKKNANYGFFACLCF